MNHTRSMTTVFLAGLAATSSLVAHDDHEPDPGGACAAVAYAVPLRKIVIDGDLSDWPDEMIRYSLRNVSDAYGPSDVDDQYLLNNPDLTAHFMVGYNRVTQVVYVAYDVRDDSHVPVHPDPDGWFAEIDATEVYFDATHAERDHRWHERSGPAHLAAMCYGGVAHTGGAYQTKTNNPWGDNPIIYYGRLENTHARMKWRRDGDRTTYEFAVQIYDHFPRLGEIKPDKRIGFDAVIVDMDLNDGKITDHAAWIPFGKPQGAKYFDASSLADLVFVKDRNSLGAISGRIICPDKRVEPQDFVVEVWHGMVPAGEAYCDADGSFTLQVPANSYWMRPRPDQGVAPFRVEVNVKAGQSTEARIEARPAAGTNEPERDGDGE